MWPFYASVISADIAARVQELCVRRHRGCRAGRTVKARACRPVPALWPTGSGAYVVVSGTRPLARSNVYGSVAYSWSRNVVPVPTVAERHAQPLGRHLMFASMNVRSLSPSKLDDLLVEFSERAVDVMLLCETWHNADSVSICRLRADGFSVVERARPRSSRSQSSLAVNYGGIAVVAAVGVRITAINVGVQPSTFEFVAARISPGLSSCVVIVVYRLARYLSPLFFSRSSPTCWIVCRRPVILSYSSETTTSGWSGQRISTLASSVS